MKFPYNCKTGGTFPGRVTVLEGRGDYFGGSWRIFGLIPLTDPAYRMTFESLTPLSASHIIPLVAVVVVIVVVAVVVVVVAVTVVIV